MTYSRFALLALFLIAAPWPGTGHAADAEDIAKLLEEATLTLGEAVDAGLAQAGDGVVFHAELERDGGRAVFSIDVAQGKKTCNVVLDAKEGGVVERVVEDEDRSAVVAASKVTLAGAIATALAAREGRAVEARLSVTTGRPVITVRILAKGRIDPVKLDGATGALIEGGAPREERFTDSFSVEPGEWASMGRNPWFVLEPGHVLVLEGGNVQLTVTVLDETRTIDGVETRVVEEREQEGGKLIEVSRNFFAISKRTNSVYYFGEEVDEYEDGKVVGHEGAWVSGRNGARFGLMMAGTPLLGARYYQEIAPGVAMDRAEIVELAETVKTPAGVLGGCLRIQETTPLEEGKTESKSYAPGIGLVRDGPLRLVRDPRAK